MNIQDLIAEGEAITYMNEEFKIIPLNVKTQAIIGELQAQEKFAEASQLMFVKTIQGARPDWLEEDILKINDKGFLDLVTETMLKVNKIEIKEQVKKNQ